MGIVVSSGRETPRRRVLISAYACGPGDEPEASAGWEFARAAAAHSDVWIVTRRRFASAISAELSADPMLAAHVTVVTLELSSRVLALKRGTIGVYWYYALWQRTLAKHARDLHREVGFDVAHHITFANDWLPCGLSDVPVPFVWGPVGGSSRTPLWRLRHWLGLRGFATEVVRSAATAPLRRAFGDHAAQRAALVVAQNPDVAHRFRRARRIVVEPNAAFDLDADVITRRTPDARPTAVFVARLLAWKGGRIAVAALADPRLSDWRMEVFGAGYERRALDRLARRLGVAERITFHGHRPRTEVLAALSRAEVFVFPSMHDQAGWAVAEASTAGVPVVCLPLGGPPVLAVDNAHIAPIDGDIAAGFAEAMLDARAAGGSPHTRWSPSRLATLVDGWYDTAVRERRTA